jgi:hypothetical protein
MQPNESVEQLEEFMNQTEGINLISAYRAILQTLARLEAGEYTSDCERQAEVVVHNDLPDPASDCGTQQG